MNEKPHITADDNNPRTIHGGVQVRIIAARFLEGRASIGEIASQYHLSLGDVHAAMAFYFDHQDWFDTQDREEAEAATMSKAQTDERLEQIRERLRKQQKGD